MARKKIYKIPIQLMELEKENFHLLIESTFPNGETGKWVVDTGASKSVFDINLRDLYSETDKQNAEFQSAGIGELKIETSPGIIAQINFGEFVLNNFQIALIDLQHINGIYNQLSNFDIAGLLGSDVLVKYNAEINLTQMVIKFYQ